MRVFSLFLASILLFAQAPSRLQVGYDSIQPSTLKADLTFLSSDALEGRRSLERGSEVAIQWIASEFAKAGLKPAAGDSFLQAVPLIEYQVDRAQTALTLRHGDKAETFHAPEATGAFSNEATVSGAVVFAGFGITASELGYDDYAGIDAKGKIVLIFNHEPQEFDANSIFNGRGNTRYANNYSKVLNAQRHGAIAVLTMADPNHASGGAGRGAAAGRGRGQQQQQLRPHIPPEALAEGGTAIPTCGLSAAVAAKLFDAAGKSAADVQTAIDGKLAPASFDVPETRVELRTVVAERKRAISYNVAGLLEGSDPSLKAETIVFSAHHDHDGVGPAGGIMHGADDNGSGTVGVVALSHAFASNPVKPKRSVLFIVFAAEERGLLGAYYYVSHPLRPLDTTRAEINFDMIGRNEAPVNPDVPQPEISADTSNELGLIGTHYSPDYRETVERNNRIVGLQLTYKWDHDATQQVLFRSDQFPFLMHDIPAVWWFTGFHPDYHQVTDTVEKINFQKMAKILKLAYLTGFEFADGQNPPRLQARARSVE
ncbi:Peptidase M28 [Candidatus Sulfopaludibacter sp. SbA3]|nr:Peptidase M28 [Candidatus Sulfopaludibacter sp. SbA3]